MRRLRPRVRSALLALALGGGAPLAAQAIGQGFELLPLVRRAEVTDTANLLLRALELRVYAGLDQSDSVRATAERWIARAPGDESPWREWAVALEDQHQFDDARVVLQRGRRALGRPTAL